jgi:hypothetical protein
VNGGGNGGRDGRTASILAWREGGTGPESGGGGVCMEEWREQGCVMRAIIYRHRSDLSHAPQVAETKARRLSAAAAAAHRPRFPVPFPGPAAPLAALRQRAAALSHLPPAAFKLVHAGAVMKDDAAPRTASCLLRTPSSPPRSVRLRALRSLHRLSYRERLGPGVCPRLSL